MPSSTPSEPIDDRRRLLLVAVGLVIAAAIPVGLTWWLFGAVAAQAFYIGIVMMTTTVRAIPRAAQLWSAVWVAAVSAAGALIGPHLAGVIIGMIVISAVQIVFTRMSMLAIAVTPAIFLLHAYFADAGSAFLIGIGTLAGALYLIVAARLVKMTVSPTPVATGDAVVHAVLYCIGCVLMLLFAEVVGADRGYWGVLAFCLMFLPVAAGAGSIAGYVLGTATGTVIALVVAVIGWQWLWAAALVIGVAATVVFTLAQRSLYAVIAVTSTVLLAASASPQSTAAVLGIERAGLAAVAAAIALLLLSIIHALEPMLKRLLTKGTLA